MKSFICILYQKVPAIQYAIRSTVLVQRKKLSPMISEIFLVNGTIVKRRSLKQNSEKGGICTSQNIDGTIALNLSVGIAVDNTDRYSF